MAKEKVKIKVDKKGLASVVAQTLAAASLNCGQLAHDLLEFNTQVDDQMLDLIRDLRESISGLAKLIV